MPRKVRRKKLRKLKKEHAVVDKGANNKPPRPEAEVIAELEALCHSPGYAHVLAYLCYRDNHIKISQAIKPSDLDYIRGPNRLIRTELTTLIGLMVKQPLDLTIPANHLMQQYIDATERLLDEIHQSMSGAFIEVLKREGFNSETDNPFKEAKVLREPIFYAAESAYSFQYNDFSIKKYEMDNPWLVANKGFKIDDGAKVADAICKLMDKKLQVILREMPQKPPAEWTFLPAYVFTRGKRTEFHQLLAFIQAQKETIALVADAVDRVQRSFKEAVLLDELRKQGILEIHFVREGMVISENAGSSDIMRWDFAVLAAKAYVTQLSENVKRSLDWKVRNGQCIRPAPLGYRNIRTADGKSHVEPDPHRAHIVTRLFNEYATGLYTLGDITAKAKEYGLRTLKGHPLNKSSIHFMFNNRFYHGEMEVKGTYHSHNYQPIISRKTFDTCQDVMHGWEKKPFKYAGKDFVFRGILRCAVTGQSVWADTKKKTLADGSQAEWTYLVATHPDLPNKKVYVREEEALSQVKSALNSLHIPETVFQELLHTLRSGYISEQDFHNEQLLRIESDLKVVKLKLDRLMDLLLEKEITAEEHRLKRESLTRRQSELREELKLYDKADNAYRMSLELLLSVASRSLELFDREVIRKKGDDKLYLLEPNPKRKNPRVFYEVAIQCMA